MIDGITPVHLIIVLVIALVILGPGKLPGVGKAIGESIREFRHSVSDVKEAVHIEPLMAPSVAPGAQAVPAAASAAGEAQLALPVAAAPAPLPATAPEATATNSSATHPGGEPRA